MNFEVKRPITLEAKYLNDLMITAVESGSGYWAQELEIKCSETGETISYQDEKLFEKDWILTCEDAEDEEEVYTVTKEEMVNAVLHMPNHHLRNLIDDNYDAETADVWLQCGIFKEIVFG